MTTNRLEVFSDGVLAIIITIMVLELEIPEGNQLYDLLEVLPTFFTYLFSFIYLGIYWNNHHHLWQVVEKLNGRILWANLHLLFWLSLFPFATGWIGNNLFDTVPVALYGGILFMASLAWFILCREIIIFAGISSEPAKAIKDDKKTKISLVLYAFGIGLSFLKPILGCLAYALLAFFWFIPDKRIENLRIKK